MEEDLADVKLREQRKINKKASQVQDPAFTSVEINSDGTIAIESINLKTVQVNYYNINAEILFSR